MWALKGSSGWLAGAVFWVVYAPVALLSLVGLLDGSPSVESFIWISVLNSCIYGAVIAAVWVLLQRRPPDPHR
jgi:hypothetical protein